MTEPDNTEQVNALAREIADEAARYDIEDYCQWDESYEWSRTDSLDLENDNRNRFTVLAIRYLDLRGLLERHPEHPEWVRVKR